MEARIKAERAVLRSSFTKTINALNDEFRKDPCDNGIISDKFTKLESLMSEIKELDLQMKKTLLDVGAKEEQLLAEIESAENYSDNFITMKRLVNEKINVVHVHRSVMNEPNMIENFGKGKCYKLPKIEIKKFDGELINWLSFWSQFKKIHEDEDLHDCDKFQYLFQSMQPGTRARELIESYPLTSENYIKAVTALEERFGKKDLLIEVYVRELLKLIIKNVRSTNKDRLHISKLFDKIEAHLRALESMGVSTSSNAAWLYPMVESCLSEEILKAWQRYSLGRDTAEDPSSKSRLSKLLEFLKREVEGEERLSLARKGFEGYTQKETSKDKFKKKEFGTPTAAGLFTKKEIACIFCEKAHASKDCMNAQSMSLKDKTSKLREKKCCFRCLRPGHVVKFCKSFTRCHLCSKEHPVILCPDLPGNTTIDKKEEKEPIVQTTFVQEKCTNEVTLMTLSVKIVGIQKTKKVRALLDCGSQKSYILKSTAEELGLVSQRKISLAHSLFGGVRTEPKEHKIYRIHLQSVDDRLRSVIELEFLDNNLICGEIPRLPKGRVLEELKRNKIWISDIGSGCPKIELLIGSDIYGQILTGHIKQLNGGLTAIETKLGWTVCGQSGQNSETNTVDMSAICMNVRYMSVSQLWSLETIGIKDPGECLTKAEEEEEAQEQFMNTVCRKEDGRYSISLPWLNSKQDLSSNLHIAQRRLFSTTKKLRAANQYQEYDQVFREWLEEMVIEKVPEGELGNRSHYLPHHPVVKLNSSTTRIRPVFDASSKDPGKPSLNDCLLKGPNLIEQIPTILLRFRKEVIGVAADIRRAFLQIEVNEEDRDFLRFLWWEKENQVQVFRHKRLVFGLTCSPFLLGAVIQHHLANVSEDMSHAEKLAQSFYIDNCITSVNDQNELEEFIRKSTKLFSEAKMDLRMWMYGPIDETTEDFLDRQSHIDFESNETVPLLGLLWNRMEDTLQIICGNNTESLNPSKREVLSLVQQIFDPIGILVPALLPAKLLVQQAWSEKLDWDTPLPEEIRVKFIKWFEELPILSELKFPRRIGFGNHQNWSLEVFCDASQNAYATVIFLRCDLQTEVKVQLLGAKSRLSPLKKMTIPRLELLACTLGARLAKFILEALNVTVPVKFWTDSTTAIAWIKRNEEWGTFVRNRVREIRELTDPEQWFHIPGCKNPADLPSRGCSPKQLLMSRWWEGPDWMRKPPECWPKTDIETDEELIIAERKKGVVTSMIVNTEKPMFFERFSKFSRIVRVLAWMKRFLKRTQKIECSTSKILSDDEIEEAENHLWLIIQRETDLEKEIPKIGLMTVKDENGLIRVKSKIIEREDEFAFRYPILLPCKHHVISCLIRDYHINNCHAGVQTLASVLREKYWILKFRRTIKTVVSKCVRCKRFTAKAPTTTPIHLPLDRVREAAVFEIIGIDLCGPLFLRNKTKAWIVLYTCAIYRAIHLEVVTSLSTETFIQSLQRFIARRGRPAIIYTDNATNFTGTNNALKTVDWNKVVSSEGLKAIKWKFIPPAAPWWGGWWERLIRSTKALLVRVLGRSSLSYEELVTVVCDVEAVINSRPLTYISDQSGDFTPLTPSMFIQEIREIGVPDFDQINRSKLQLRQAYCQKLREQLRSRFRKEYLGQLVVKTGENKTDIQVGDVVLVEIDNKKRLHWPMAKVEKLFPGRDGHPRVAKVKTQGGTLFRPLPKLYPLEVSSRDDPVLQDPQQVRSRAGRLIKPPERLKF